MPVSIFDLRRGLCDVDVPIGKEVVHVTYRPGVITPGFTDRYWFAPAVWLAQAVEKWDVLGEDDQPLPLRARDAQGRETNEPSKPLTELPNDFLMLVQRAINRDLLPGKRFGATSDAS